MMELTATEITMRNAECARRLNEIMAPVVFELARRISVAIYGHDDARVNQDADPL